MLKSKIQTRQLRPQWNEDKLKEIAQEMVGKGHKGLRVEKSKITVKSLDFLVDFKHLESLEIHDIAKGISVVSNLKKLKEFAICGISTKSLDFLNELKDLEILLYQGTQLKDYDSFRKLKQIKALKLFNLKKLDNIDFIEDMESLQYLELTWCSKILKFPKLNKLTRLRRVYIDTMKRLQDISGISKAPNLEELIILQTPELPAESLKDFIKHPKLKTIIPGLDLINSKKYKEANKILPDKLTKNEFFGTPNENFELI